MYFMVMLRDLYWPYWLLSCHIFKLCPHCLLLVGDLHHKTAKWVGLFGPGNGYQSNEAYYLSFGIE